MKATCLFRLRGVGYFILQAEKVQTKPVAGVTLGGFKPKYLMKFTVGDLSHFHKTKKSGPNAGNRGAQVKIFTVSFL